MQKLAELTPEAKAEVAAVVKALAEPPKPPAGVVAAGTAAAPNPLAAASSEFSVPSLYAAAWKSAIETAHSAGRTISFRAAQDLAEQSAPHDGSGLVGTAGVAAGGIFMRDLLPTEQVVLLYEPFGAAMPYEELR
jgi:hypothetical protein